MPIVTMRRQVSGKRNGRAWPAPGEAVEVSDAEAPALVRNGLAEMAEQGEATGARVPAEEPAEDTEPEADPEDAEGPVDEPDADEEEPADPADDLDSMKLPELRELAAERDLPTSGNKATLLDRLRGE